MTPSPLDLGVSWALFDPDFKQQQMKLIIQSFQKASNNDSSMADHKTNDNESKDIKTEKGSKS